MPTGTTFLIIDPPDTPNIGRYKINYNFALLLSGSFSAITGVSASVFTNPNPTTQTVGGVLAGSTFAGNYYLQDMMDLLLYPAVTPNFTSFLMAAQATDLEVGVATPTTANFTWAIANATDLAANSISITDTTSSTLLATGLANDGAESVFTGAISKTTPSSNIWTIAADDTDGNPFSRAFTINWSYMVFYGSSASLTLNAAAIVSLSGSELTTDIDGSYALGGSNYGYLCAPNAFSTPNGFRDSSTNLPIEMAGPSDGYTSFDGAFYYSPVVVNRNGVAITYRVYRTRNTTTISSMSVGITGGTTATLQSVINAGNTAVGNAAVLGNFTATTFYSGNTELSTLLSGGEHTRVQPGTNTTTGGTASAPTVNVIPSPSFTSVFATSISAVTFYSGATDLSELMGSALPAASDGEMLYNSGGTWVHRDMSIRASDNPTEWVMIGGSGSVVGAGSDNVGVFAGINHSILTSYESAILGGSSNVINSSYWSVILGGETNSMSFSEDSSIVGAFGSTISGGFSHSIIGSVNSTITGIGAYSSIINGSNSLATNAMLSSIIASSESSISDVGSSAILGGDSNNIHQSNSSVLLGGQLNNIFNSSSSSLVGSNIGILSASSYSSVVGGDQVSIYNSIYSSAIGGFMNTMVSDILETSVMGLTYFGTNSGGIIIGGQSNLLDTVINSSILNGGENKIIDSAYSSIVNGFDNTLDTTYECFIVGGESNIIRGNSHYSTIIGANENLMIGAVTSSILAGSINSITGLTNDSMIMAGSGHFLHNTQNSAIIGGAGNSLFGTQGSAIIAAQGIVGTKNYTLYTNNISASAITAVTISATTFYSAGTDLSNYLTGGTPTYVQNGTNTTTGGTITRPTVNVVPTPVFTSVSALTITATTIYSGGVDLSVFLTGGTPTYVQNGTNTTTGGTISRPTINIVPSPSFTSVFATSISATTLFSGSTDLSRLLTGGTSTNEIATVSRAITQTTHGFVVGNLVKFTGSAYAKAQADVEANAEVVGIVSAVAGSNDFTLTTHGYVTGLSGLTGGTTYFLSETTAGLLTETAPSTTLNVRKSQLIALSTSTGHYNNFVGYIIP